MKLLRALVGLDLSNLALMHGDEEITAGWNLFFDVTKLELFYNSAGNEL